MDRNYDNFISKVFMLMTCALLLTGGIAYVCSYIPALRHFVCEPAVLITALILELILVFVVGAKRDKLDSAAMTVLFFAYSAVSGVTFTSVFLVYELGSIFGAFLSAMLMFAGCWCLKKVVKVNVPTYRTVFLGALIGLLIAEVIAMFIPGISFVVCLLGIIIFLPLTIYDLKKMDYLYDNLTDDEVYNTAIYCALELYMDIINITLKLLRFFGKKKN